MEQLSNRVLSLSESETLKMAKLSREMASQGIDIVNFNLGEPDFNVPDHIQEAAIHAIRDNISHYPPVAGFPALRKAISEKLKRENGVEYKPEQVLVSTGAKQCISNIIFSIINPGDEVLIPLPYWVSYKDMVLLAGGIPVFITGEEERQFKISGMQLEREITPKTKMFIFSSPCNPTGSVYTKAELDELSAVFAKNPKILVVSDEIYEHILFSGKHETIASCKGMSEQVAIVNGFSKSFAMTGWRVGYMAAPLWLTQACEKIQGQITSGTNTVAQMSCIAGLTGEQEPIQKMKKAFHARRDLMYKELQSIPGLKFHKPDGAYYYFPDVSFYLGKKFGSKIIRSASELSMFLLEEGKVSVVGGEAFGDGNCIRISYSASDEKILEGMKRIRETLKRLV